MAEKQDPYKCSNCGHVPHCAGIPCSYEGCSCTNCDCGHDRGEFVIDTTGEEN